MLTAGPPEEGLGMGHYLGPAGDPRDEGGAFAKITGRGPLRGQPDSALH